MPPSVTETKSERKPPAPFFLNSPRSPASTPAPPGSPLDHPPPTTLAVDALPDSAPPRAYSGFPATSENALSITASVRARIPGRHRPICESLFRADSEKQTTTPRKGRLAISPCTTVPANRCLYGRPPAPPPPGCASAEQSGSCLAAPQRPAQRHQ